VEAENCLHARFNLECFINNAKQEGGPHIILHDFDGNELINYYTYSHRIWEIDRYIIEEYFD
jgi:hypothetical protein